MSTTNRCDNMFVKNSVDCDTIGCKNLFVYKLKESAENKTPQFKINTNATPYEQLQQQRQLEMFSQQSQAVNKKPKASDYEKVDIVKVLTEKYEALKKTVEEIRSADASSTEAVGPSIPQEITDEIESLKAENETLKRTIEGFDTRLTALSTAQTKVPKVGPKGPKGDSIKKMSQLTDVEFDASKIDSDFMLVYSKKVKKFIAQPLLGEE